MRGNPVKPRQKQIRPVANTRSAILPELQGLGAKSLAMSLLAALAILYSLYFAADILLPVSLAIYLNLLLSPLIRRLQRVGIPQAASALVVVVLLVWIVVAAISVLNEPAQQWISQAPERLRDLRTNLANVKQPMENIQELSNEMKGMADLDKAGEEVVQKVEIEKPDLVSQLVERLPTSVTSIGIVIFLTFFLLASTGNFSRKFTHMGRCFAERRRILMVISDIRKSISTYLVTITCINTVLGFAVTGTMYLLGFEDPWMWGIVAGLLNFIPYIGPMVTILVLAFVGITTFPDSIKAAISPLLYFCLSTVEGQVITPMVIGQRLELSPVAVFLFLVFWGWIWGPIGMLLAVPIMVGIKIVLENSPSVSALAPLLSK
jgi:predicted PurR-regulated permease PerM